MDMKRNWLTLFAMLAILALLGAACGDDEASDAESVETDAEAAGEAPEEEPPAEAPEEETPAEEASDGEAPEEEAPASVDLASVCPDPLVLQTDWYPSPEHGYAYRLIGDAGEFDAENGIYRGPLLDTGIDLEIRAGGPYLGFQPGTSTMYVDEGIHLAYVSTDEAVTGAASDLPTVAVMAPLEINPQILMWDPETYTFESFEDIGESGAVVNYFAGASYIDYLVGSGVLDAGQVDPSYDGTPARFVAEGGAIVQQGFATSEPFFYENELDEWSKPVDFLLVHDAGFELYSQPLVVRTDALEELRPCLEQVIPVFQQAVVDHYADPDPTSEVILDIVEQLDGAWVVTPGQMDYSAASAVELGVASNGPDDTVGNFDDDRMATVFDQLVTVFDDVPDDLAPTDLYTNEFIDPAIGFE
jgi:hypothetical protein